MNTNKEDLEENWVLVDYKIGSNMQAIALAESMKIKFNIINIQYNFFAKLPNILMPIPFFQVKSPDFVIKLKNQKPKMIISASRKTALVSAMLKKLCPQIKNIHILNPNLSKDLFDFVILPQHDGFVKLDSQNVIRVIGSLCNIQSRINSSKESFKKEYSKFIKEKYIAILVGGDTKDFSFNEETSKKFVEQVQKIASEMSMKLFITFSRRTPKILREIFRNIAWEDIKIYDPEEEGINPYPAFLENAKFVISTCDSISMCSEVVSYGTPFYFHIPEGFKSNKHLAFVYQLQDLGIAKILKTTDSFLQEYNYTPLNESNKIAEYILSKQLSVKYSE